MVSILIATVLLFCFACTQPFMDNRAFIYKEPVYEEPVYEEPEREWTFLIYMAADNSLDTYATSDIAELEGYPVTVLVLIDRAAGAGWSGTQLYEIQDGSAERIALPALEITTDNDIELNMSDAVVLEKFVKFGKEEYPANHYGLILWGHGTGWRSSGAGAMSRGIAVDETSGTYMGLASLGAAVKNMGLSFIGIDACFGGLLEIAYELKDTNAYLAASPSLIPAAGWNYRALFVDFLAKDKTLRTAAEFGRSTVNAFKAQYAGEAEASISLIDLSKTAALLTAFDDFSGTLATYIDSATKQNNARNLVLFGSVKNYYEMPVLLGTSDYYIDIRSFAEKMESETGVLSANLLTALNSAIPLSWSKEGGDGLGGNIGVYVTPVQRSSGGIFAANELPETYSHGNVRTGIIALVKDSSHWPPAYGSTANAGSFLDKLFRYNTW